MILIDEKLRQEILSHVNECLPEEACGIIGGKNHHAEVIIPVENKYHSHMRFHMDEIKLLEALSILDQQGLDLIGIFHSHPNGPSHPSNTDIEELRYLDTIQIICTPNRDKKTMGVQSWDLIGYQVIEQDYQEVLIKFT